MLKYRVFLWYFYTEFETVIDAVNFVVSSDIFWVFLKHVSFLRSFWNCLLLKEYSPALNAGSNDIKISSVLFNPMQRFEFSILTNIRIIRKTLSKPMTIAFETKNIIKVWCNSRWTRFELLLAVRVPIDSTCRADLRTLFRTLYKLNAEFIQS